MSDKATEVWKRIYSNALHESSIFQMQNLLLDTTYWTVQSIQPVVQNSFEPIFKQLSESVIIPSIQPVVQNALEPIFKQLSESVIIPSIQPVVQNTFEPIFKQLSETVATYRSIQNSCQTTPLITNLPRFDSKQNWEQFWQSASMLVEELQDILPEMNWEPSDELTNSINYTIQEVTSLQNEAKAEIPLGIPTDKPLTKDYIRQNIWNILSVLLSIISILLYFAPNPNEEVMIDNQHTMIEQNNEQLELDRKRNELLQQLCDTVQAINEETDITGDQADTLIEQPNDLTQAADSPSGEDTADREQQ